MSNDLPFFVPLGVGMESDLAEQLVQPGSVPLLENVVANNRGQWRRRTGSAQLSASDGVNAWRLEVLGGKPVRFGVAPNPVYAWDSIGRTWVAGGLGNDPTLISYRTGPVGVSSVHVFDEVPAGEAARAPDVAIANGYAVVCLERSSTLFVGTTFSQVVIVDLATGQPVYRRALGASAIRARPFAVGTKCAVAYDNNGTITVDVYDLTTLSISGTQAIGSCTPGTQISVRAGSLVAGSNKISVLYQENTSGYLTCAEMDVTSLAGFTTFTAKTAVGGLVVPNLAFAWLQDFGSSGKFSVIIADTTAGLRVLWALQAPAAGASNATATHVLDNTATAAPSGSTAGIRNLVGSTTSSSAAGLYRVLYEVIAPDLLTQGAIKQAVYTGSATLGTAFRSVGIRSQLWAHDTHFYLWGAFAGTDQQTYFTLAIPNDLTVDIEPAPQAVAFPRGAGGLTERLGFPSQVATAADGSLWIAATQRTRVESVDVAGTATGLTSAIMGVELVRLEHKAAGDVSMSRGASLIGSMFTPGGALGAYDGHTYGLPGFAYYPPSIGTASAAGGNLTPSARYYYCACFSFVDRLGRKWRSAPTAPIPADTTGTDFKFTVTIETLRLVDRGLPSAVGGYQIELYRTDANEVDAHFLVASVQNDPGATTISLVDNVADANLGEQLYTDGGGLENQLLPPVSHVSVFQGRLFCVEAGTGTLWYSLESDLNHGLIFSETATLDVEDPNDPITGIAATDTYLAVMKGSKVFVVTGQGCDALGNGATYEARRIEDGFGCSEAPSVLAAPDNTVWFKANSDRAGFHRVNGLAVEYVGQGVRAYNDLPVTSAIVVKSKSEMRWYTASGRTLVRNWITGAWSTNTEQPCWSAATGYGEPIYANTAGTILQDGADGVNFTENGTAFSGRIRSPWLLIDEMQGWERIKRIQGVGQSPRAHKLSVNLYRDFDDTDQIGALTKTFDGSGTKWTWELRPRVQQVSSLLVEIVIDTATPVDNGPDVAGVTLIAAVQKGLRRTSPRNRLSPA